MRKLLCGIAEHARKLLADEGGFFALPASFGIPIPASTSYIRSIQQVSITIPTAGTTGTATITAVNTANSIIFFQGNTAQGGAAVTTAATRVTLTNSTTVTATRNSGVAGTSITLLCTVVEFISAAVSVSVQYGTIAIGSGVSINTATITSVNTANASLFYLGTSGTPIFNIAYCSKIALTNGTTVTATRTGSTSAVTLAFCVVEWAPAVVKSSQHRLLSSGATTTVTDTIGAVNPNNTILLPGGQGAGGSSEKIGFYYLSLTGSTSVVATRKGITTSVDYAYDVLEFQPGVLNSAVQRGTITLNNVTSNTATITSVNTAQSVANLAGWDTAETGSSAGSQIMADLTLTNATTLTAAVDTADTNELVLSYEVAEFT